MQAAVADDPLTFAGQLCETSCSMLLAVLWLALLLLLLLLDHRQNWRT
jgi:hypothetical protein